MNMEMLDQKRLDRPRAPALVSSGASPRLAMSYFAVGICWLVGGVALGIWMSSSQDFLLKPVHAHVNLLGWVTNALFGCFHGLRDGPELRRDWLGLAAFNIGCLSMLLGLSGLLLDKPVPAGAIPAGATLVAIAILQMAVVILRSLWCAPFVELRSKDRQQDSVYPNRI